MFRYRCHATQPTLLFTTLAYNSGNEVSLEGLSKSSGVAKNTIKRYLEYLEAAFLIRRVERIDQNAKRLKRAMCFKVYLTNPSMRAALFGQLDMDSEAMGAMTETAIFSQWQHSEMEVQFVFEPASLYACLLGANILRHIDKKIRRRAPKSDLPTVQ